MSQKTIFKTIYQYNKEPLSKADMDRLDKYRQQLRKEREDGEL